MTQVQEAGLDEKHRQPAQENADRELKARHRNMWALGNYPAVASDVIAELGPTLVGATQLGARDRVLDVAAGTGNVAIPAARTGALVVATDLTPELLDVGRRDAAELGVELVWEVADAEALPYADGGFDAVLSCVGVMFAPRHQTAADELVRVCRPGGTIGLIAWTPSGFIGQMFAATKPYAPTPPPGAQPPPLWGDEGHVRELLGHRVEQVRAERRSLRVDAFATPEAFRDFFKASYGPTIAAYRALAAEPDRATALDEALVDLARRFDTGSGETVMEWEYLLLTARRRLVR